MPATLVVLTGPLNGQLVTLSGVETSIGRDESNRIPVGDLGLSRRHCVIEVVKDGFRIRDLDSLNGTFVNGVPVKQRALKHGDEVRIGHSVFLFLLDRESGTASVTPVTFHDEHERETSTVALRLENARYLQPSASPPLDAQSGQVTRDLHLQDGVAHIAPAAARSPDATASAPPLDAASVRVTRDLETLLRISTVVHVVRGRDALQRKLLELTLEVVPAEFGAILLAGENGEDFGSVVASHREPDHPVTISRTIARRAIAEGVALLCNNVPGSQEFGAAKSAVASRTQSIVCAPITIFDRALGVLYLATTDRSRAFDTHHLELVTGIAGIAAVALENARHLEWLEGEARRLEADLEIERTMVGEAACMREVYELVAKVAPRDSTVLIRGESGTGKELVARAIHANSARARRAFVPINCAALVETLLESELFGHEKGAFTGAISQKRGKVEVADGGTVFLDEVRSPSKSSPRLRPPIPNSVNGWTVKPAPSPR